jgi:hypothetical protein
VKDDVLPQTELVGTKLEAVPVGLAVPLLHVRVRGAQNNIGHVRVACDDGGERIDDVFDPLVRRQEAEGEKQSDPLDTETLLAGFAVRQCGDPVRDEVDLVGGHPVHLAQEFAGTVTHHDHAAR